MKKISTFLLFTFLSFQAFSQCPDNLSLNGGNRLFSNYTDLTSLNTAAGVLGANPMVTYNGTSYPLQRQGGTAIRFRNEPAATGNPFTNILTGTQTLTYSGADGSFTCTFNNSVLPVDLLSFSAEKRTDNVLLKWATTSELNNSHFTIEHSTDSKKFTSLEKVEGMGTYDGLTEYSFTHEKAQNGNNFYRLKQVDFDGAFTFSPIAQVKVASNQVSIKQTLVTDVLQVSLNAESTTDVSYQVINAKGQSLQSGILNARNAQQEISISELNEGIYFLHSIVNGELSVNKFVKF